MGQPLRKVMLAFAQTFFKLYQKPLVLYDYQREFVLDESTFRIINKARQLGMSFAIALEGVMEAFFNPNYIVLYVSTGEDAAKRVLQYCYDLIYSLSDDYKVKLLVASTTEIKLQNGSKLVSLPNNPSTIRGFRADRVYIDEAAHFQNDKEIMRAIQPSITRGGKLTLLSTPCGRANIFYEKWEEDPHYSKHTISWERCPDEMYQKRLKDLRRTMDELSFQQEYSCCFITEDMSLFTPEIVKPCIDMDIVASKENNVRFRVMGLDIARVVDSTVITIADYLKNDLVIVTKIEELRNVDFDTQMAVVKEMWFDYKVDKINADATGLGAGMCEKLQTTIGTIVDAVTFSNEKKELLITNLKNLFEVNRIRIPPNEKLISQLYSLEKTFTPTGMIKYKHVGKKHDDFVWSLALAAIDAFMPPPEVEASFGRDAESISMNIKLFDNREERRPYALI